MIIVEHVSFNFYESGRQFVKAKVINVVSIP